MAWTQQQLLDVLQKHDGWLMSQPGIEAVGIGLGDNGEPVLEIGTANASPQTRQLIRERLRGVPVRFTETGEITAQ